ncbi:MAG: UDP-3-O-(3-hydroxymyristoyl)glucosamine N-acyltransferase [Bacteroidales bacterium]|nr:UDP-3-O-(3-hydroxymyristoyl)glucosamine N-acyltransferase [Bacteroidales bacterium]
MEFTAKTIAGFLNGEIKGDPEVKVSNISKIEEGKKGTLSFLANPKYTKYIYTTESSIVLVNKTIKLEREINPTLILVDDAYQAFAGLLEMYNQSLPKKTGIDEQVYISKTAAIGHGVYIGAFTYIGDNVKIGNNVSIHPQVYIGDNVVIQDDTKIFPGVKIYHNCFVGKNCTIHAGTVIGSDGFGFAPSNSKDYVKVPQIGNVIIEENVEIGANVTIDRATLGSTIIRKGVKLDNLIQVAHNVEIGENTVIAAQTGISGSTKIGMNCMLAGQVGLAGHLRIANDVKIGAQSGLSNNIEKEGEIVLGSPAYNISDKRREFAVARQLPSLYRKILDLEKASYRMH